MEFFVYSSLPQEPNITRMIRLLPHKNKDVPIECKLFNYALSQKDGRGHLYEALSYVWETDIKSHSIILDGCIFPVTSNLHAALINLRDDQIDRVLWVDAISINQLDQDEKSKQIPLMRTIYAQAMHVIVWLGEAMEDGDKALEGIRCLGAEQDIPEKTRDACLQLLQRNWFCRIWVLQEVGVAQCIYILCGSVQINGHVFCEGLRRLGLSSSLPAVVGPVTYLIKGAPFRLHYELDSHESLSIGELIGMYCNHNATRQHDKVYALLGLSADSNAKALKPNYRLPWDEVFKQVVTAWSRWLVIT